MITKNEIKTKYGIRIEYRNTKGQLHNRKDMPAVIEPDGTKKWYRNGLLHRKYDRPAIICRNGDLSYYKKGKRHRRDDKPAMIQLDGKYLKYYKRGLLHRDNDYPAVINKDRISAWYEKGVLHRLFGPAMIFWNKKEIKWYVNGIEYTFENYLDNLK